MRSWCDAVRKSKSSPRISVVAWRRSPLGLVQGDPGFTSTHDYAGCTVSGFGDGTRSFSLAAFMTFGANASAMFGRESNGRLSTGSSLWLAHKSVLEKGDSIETPTRVVSLSRKQVVEPALRTTNDPDFVTLSSRACGT